MVVDPDVTRDVPTTAMNAEPTVEARPPEPPAFGAWRAVRIVLAFLGVQLVVALPVGYQVGRLAGARPSNDHLPSGLLLDALAAGLGGTVLAGLVVLLLVKRAMKGPGGDAIGAAIGWRPASRRLWTRWGLAGLGTAAVYLVLGVLARLRPESVGPLAQAATAGGLSRLIWAVLAVLVAPPTEELLFRGVLYAGLSRSWGAHAAAVATTALFVGLHGSEIAGYLPGWIVITALGALALRARVVTGSLVPGIALHTGYNLGLVLVAYAL
jgi:membrane protease YdiL (CAAX protease family)